MSNLTKLAETIIVVEEGFSANEYYCTQGYVTTGFGRKVSDIKYAPLSSKKVTKEAELKFVRESIDKIIHKLSTTKSMAWSKCNEQRKAILISMAFQMGVVGLLAFHRMWSCIERADFDGAAKEMVNSKWYVQTKNRALRHSQQMRVGSTHIYYQTNGQFH